MGDLFYLEIGLLEGITLHITATPSGFFANSTRSATIESQGRFDPSPAAAAHHSHSLLELLQRASPRFKHKFAQLLAATASSAIECCIDPAFLSTPWHAATAVKEPPFATAHRGWCKSAKQMEREHTYDLNRSEDALRGTGVEELSGGVLRDWNEELQCCRELPRKTMRQRVFRAQAIMKVQMDFKQAATDGAVAVKEGRIPPINPMDALRSHVHVYNNIFFSLAVDARDMYKDCGGDRTAHKAASRDLQGVTTLNGLDIEGLHTLLTAVVDLGGQRLVAQSIIPGILQGEQASSLVYGSVDNGKTLYWSEEMHALLGKASKRLHIKESSVLPLGPAEGDDKPLDEDPDIAAGLAVRDIGGGKSKYRAGPGPVQLNGPVECKGIVGSDGRHYVLDVMRLTPRDANFPDGTTAVLRPELIKNYINNKRRQHNFKVHCACQRAPACVALRGWGGVALRVGAACSVGRLGAAQ